MPSTHLLLRWCFRVTLLCVLLFTFVMTVVHGQSASVPDLTLLFRPSYCAVPCFLGITPGQSTLNKGIDQLRASPLVKSIAPVVSAPDSPTPSGLYDVEFAQGIATLRNARLQLLTNVRTDIIEGILLLQSDIQWSDLALAFGQPAQVVLDDRFHLGLVTYATFYPQEQMYVQDMMAVCSPNETSFWNQRQSLVIGVESPTKYAQQLSYYPADAYQPVGGWLQQIHNLKQTDCA